MLALAMRRSRASAANAPPIPRLACPIGSTACSPCPSRRQAVVTRVADMKGSGAGRRFVHAPAARARFEYRPIHGRRRRWSSALGAGDRRRPLDDRHGPRLLDPAASGGGRGARRLPRLMPRPHDARYVAAAHDLQRTGLGQCDPHVSSPIAARASSPSGGRSHVELTFTLQRSWACAGIADVSSFSRWWAEPDLAPRATSGRGPFHP
jgi:hypothetical protein